MILPWATHPLITIIIWIRVREKRQGTKLIWEPIYFQAIRKYYERFFHEIHSNNSLRDKFMVGHFFASNITITPRETEDNAYAKF